MTGWVLAFVLIVVGLTCFMVGGVVGMAAAEWEQERRQ